MTGANIVIDDGMTTKMIYIDENIIEDSIALLTGDREAEAKEHNESPTIILRSSTATILSRGSGLI
ncbi:hypothetical protein [Desulfurococcus amylolyticus]|uniref:hypothetical protein n=1 Tax=Desulfurococcus amylolyticus TaxID=94694 RepID=UPI00022E220B|nr:hypothetical protein [Desulfurococcus amylolyticus]